MPDKFREWKAVADCLNSYAEEQERRCRNGEISYLDLGQCASIRALGQRLPDNGVVVADEVGMGKTRIAAALIRCVVEARGRAAILVPPNLGYQWRDELRGVGMSGTRPLLRSLWQYLHPWSDGPDAGEGPWFAEPIILLSHAFANWRLGDAAAPWRWTLLPRFIAEWRRKETGRYPREYNGLPDCPQVVSAARAIVDRACIDSADQAYLVGRGIYDAADWIATTDPGNYCQQGGERPQAMPRALLERVVGLGLGVFDLVVIDEAHKARASSSCLSRLEASVLVTSKTSRTVGLTATPVELHPSQWGQMLMRIGLPLARLGSIEEATNQYISAVKWVQQCPHNGGMRKAFAEASKAFMDSLSPYLLRRNKREDSVVRHFEDRAQGALSYRRHSPIAVRGVALRQPWGGIICAMESLSLATRFADDPRAQRLRLTAGNGHGLSVLIDAIRADDEDQAEMAEGEGRVGQEPDPAASDQKRRERTHWWLSLVDNAFPAGGPDPLFDHPALLEAMRKIEEVTARGEKVLVFGRFNRPLRALVDMLNARAMLQCLETGAPWPQSRLPDDRADHHREKAAIKAVLRQSGRKISLAEINERLASQYKKLTRRREEEQKTLLENIEAGLGAYSDMDRRIFEAFKASVSAPREIGDRHPLALVTKAMREYVGEGDVSEVSESAEGFRRLVRVLMNREDGDEDGADDIDTQGMRQLWAQFEERLHEEYNRPEGRFARLMWGGTSKESRRLLQLAFNRIHSAPRVLVCQSRVGSEGLNLHEACRTVILLHPEWNPGVAEQQVGRVDRVGSYWSHLMGEWEKGGGKGEMPRIEVHPVIFEGTYDEYNWRVLENRWDDLRAQLHGLIIRTGSEDGRIAGDLAAEINNAAPNFCPGRPSPRFCGDRD